MALHVDFDWINRKIGTHGGIYHFDSENGLARIGYIGSTSRIKVFGYNVILFFKYILRKWRQKSNA
jgi:hypothetical protein